MTDFMTPQQKEAQTRAGDQLARLWRTRIFWFPKYSPLDFWLADGEEEGQYIRAMGELKSDNRDVWNGPHPVTGKSMFTLFKVDRHMALMLAAMTYGCPSFLVVVFRNEMRAISADDITAWWLRMSGPRRVRPGAPYERAPQLLIPVDDMTPVADNNLDAVAGFHRLAAADAEWWAS